MGVGVVGRSAHSQENPLKHRTRLSIVAAALALIGGYGLWSTLAAAAGPASETSATGDGLATATFAGGCFWCMEPPFEKLDGVKSVVSGYTGGKETDPTYEQVSAGRTGHTESVEIKYDPEKVKYETLLDVFWRNVDPFARDRQFCDTGKQYRTAIFTHGDEQRKMAEESLAELQKRFDQKIVTEIEPATQFWLAEKYHQDYHRKNPVRYKFYRTGCGRDKRLHEIWGNEAGGAG